MVTRAQAKYFAERGPSVEEMDLARLQRAAIAAEAAFGAATLLEAQEIIGAAVPGLVTSMTVGTAWTDQTGASPQATADETITAAAGNPGAILFDVGASSGDPDYRVNSGAWTTCPDSTLISVNTGDTLGFRLVGASRSAVIRVFDNTTGAQIGDDFTITNT